MKNGIEFYDSRGYDRVIGVQYENGEIKNIDFFQGDIDSEIVSSLSEKMFEEINIHLLEIFKRLERKKYDMDFEELLNNACELYCTAFIFQLDLY
jgi:hypothetical protein